MRLRDRYGYIREALGKTYHMTKMREHISVSQHSCEHLHHRRQYLLGPREAANAPKNFCRIQFNDLHLAHHPDLNVSAAEGESFKIAVLGEILNPRAPHQTNSDIVQLLASKSGKEDEVIESTEQLGGRWVLLISGPNRTIVLQDCSGFRETAFIRSHDGTWCASDTSLIARELGLPLSEEVCQLIRGQYYRDDLWLPFDVTAVQGCRQLIANHLLNFEKGVMERYWPRRPRVVLDLATASEKAAIYLKGMVEAAAARAPLSVSLTAGKDSRMILAATREIADSCFYYTTVRPGQNYRLHQDTRTPARILKHFGLKHNVIDASAPLSSTLQIVYRTNNTATSVLREGLTNAWREHLPPGSWRTTGHQGADNLFLFLNDTSKNCLDALIPQWNYDNTASTVIEYWLHDANDAAHEYNHAVSDLFYSEFRLSRWAAHHQSQYDLAIETFGPHNCRALIEAMQSVPIEERNSGRLYREIVGRLWPELLNWPINPRDRLGEFIKSIRRTRVGNFYRFRLKNRSITTHHIDGEPVEKFVRS